MLILNINSEITNSKRQFQVMLHITDADPVYFLSLNNVIPARLNKDTATKKMEFGFQEPDDGRRHHFYHDKRKYVSNEVHGTEVRNAIHPENARLKPFTFHELYQPGVKGKIFGTTPPKPTHDLFSKLLLSQTN